MFWGAVRAGGAWKKGEGVSATPSGGEVGWAGRREGHFRAVPGAVSKDTQAFEAVNRKVGEKRTGLQVGKICFLERQF